MSSRHALVWPLRFAGPLPTVRRMSSAFRAAIPASCHMIPAKRSTSADVWRMGELGVEPSGSEHFTRALRDAFDMSRVVRREGGSRVRRLRTLAGQKQLPGPPLQQSASPRSWPAFVSGGRHSRQYRIERYAERSHKAVCRHYVPRRSIIPSLSPISLSYSALRATTDLPAREDWRAKVREAVVAKLQVECGR